MKKNLVISILLIGIVLISGCTSEEKTNSETSTYSQIYQELDTKNPNLIIKQSDVPGLKLDGYNFLAIPKSSYYILKNGKEYIKETRYQDALPLGTRKVGESSQWSDKSGRSVIVGFINYDSNSGFKEEIIVLNETLFNESEGSGEVLDFGNPNIGDSCMYFSQIYNNKPDISQTLLKFVYKNYFVSVIVVDEKAKSKNEAIRIAKIIKSRLD